MSDSPKQSLLRRAISAVRRRLFPNASPAQVLPRAHYKAVWDAQTGTEEAAKMAVAGHTDEALLSHTAEGTLSLLRATVGLKPTDRVLEIGAGVGRVGRVLAPQCAEWIGCDVSANMIRHMTSRLADLPNVRLVELNGFDLSPIASASVDVVYCVVVFMHLDEWERYNYVLEAMRVLRPGGRLLIDNFNLLSNEGWVLFDELRKIDPLARPSHASKSSTPAELNEYLKRAGFEAIGMKEENLWVIAWGTKPVAV